MVTAYDRGADGSLRQAGSYATGGKGGRLQGAAVDFTASQGALVADRSHRELIAVNAGSDTIMSSGCTATGSAGVRSSRPAAASRSASPCTATSSTCSTPAAAARSRATCDLGGRLWPVPAWHRELGLDPAAAPEFTHTPGQVAFSPDGRHLIVTTKAASNSLLVFDVGRRGHLARQPVVRAENGTVPFGVDFDAVGHVAVIDAGAYAVATYDLTRAGRLVPLQRDRHRAGGHVLDRLVRKPARRLERGERERHDLRTDRAGGLTKITDTATDPGTVDADFTRDGSYLYVQTGGKGRVDAFRVAADGGSPRSAPC